MKKLYSSPEIKAIAYAQFESVYTAGCNKTDNPKHGCSWSVDFKPNDGYDYSDHKNLGGGGSI